MKENEAMRALVGVIFLMIDESIKCDKEDICILHQYFSSSPIYSKDGFCGFQVLSPPDAPWAGKCASHYPIGAAIG